MRMCVTFYGEMYRGHRIGKVGLFGNLAVTCGWPYHHQPRSRTIRSTNDPKTQYAVDIERDELVA